METKVDLYMEIDDLCKELQLPKDKVIRVLLISARHLLNNGSKTTDLFADIRFSALYVDAKTDVQKRIILCVAVILSKFFTSVNGVLQRTYDLVHFEEWYYGLIRKN